MIGSSGLLLGYLATLQRHEHLAGDGDRARSSASRSGSSTALTVIKTKLPSFIVTLATFFVLQGVNAAGTLKLTGQTAIQNIDTASGFDDGAPVLRRRTSPTTTSR